MHSSNCKSMTKMQIYLIVIYSKCCLRLRIEFAKFFKPYTKELSEYELMKRKKSLNIEIFTKKESIFKLKTREP